LLSPFLSLTPGHPTVSAMNSTRLREIVRWGQATARIDRKQGAPE
jgi:hypothetical protein